VSPSTSHNGFPAWISEIGQLPDFTFEFDMSAIHQSEVKKEVLKRCTSAGDDGILKKLPSCHNFCFLKYGCSLILPPSLGLRAKPYYYIKGRCYFSKEFSPNYFDICYWKTFS